MKVLHHTTGFFKRCSATCSNVCIVLLAYLALWSMESKAQINEQRITLQEAVDLFSTHSLSLQLARANVAEWTTLVAQASAYPNPSVQLLHEPLFNNGASLSESYVNLIQRIEWSGVRNARVNAARKLAASAGSRFQADSLSLVFKLTKTFIEAASFEAQLDYLEDVADVFREADAAAQAQYSQGELSAYQVRRLKVERARYENLLALTELSSKRALEQLNTWLLPSERSNKRYIPEYTLALLQTPAPLDALLDSARAHRPEYAEALLHIEATRFTLEETQKSVRPAPLLTTGYKRESTGFSGLFLGAQFELPVLSRKEGLIQAQYALIHQAETRLMLLEQEIEQEVTLALETFNSLFNRISLISNTLLDQTDQLLESARIGYIEGEMSLVELLDAADAFYDAKETSTLLISEAIVAYYDLMRSTGHIPLH